MQEVESREAKQPLGVITLKDYHTMTFQIYSAKYLLRKGISFCKMVCKERGIVPTGDKRQLFTWTQAIMQWQESFIPVEPVLESATICYDDSVEGSCDGEYCVVVGGGNVVHRTRTYAKAETFCKGKYNLVSPQEEAQLELEQELEQQGAIAVEAVTVELESGDEKEDYPEKPHYSVREDYPERDRNYAIQEIDFGTYEVLCDNVLVDSITRDFELGLWWVGLKSFENYSDAEQFVIYQHREGFYDDERGSGSGSGRKEPKIVTEFVGNMGTIGEYHRVYSNSSNGKVFLGTIYFRDDQGWSLNGREYHSLETMTKMLLDPVTVS